MSLATSTDRVPALEALGDAFCMVDEARRVTYWNAAAEERFGISREDALGRPLDAVLPAGTGSLLAGRLAEVAAGGAPLHAPFSQGGDGHGLQLHAAPLGDGGLALHFRDDAEHARLAERYSRLLAAIRDGFLAVDRDWRVLYVNPAAELLLRVRLPRAVGASLLDYLPPDPPELAAALRQTMADGIPRELEAVQPRVAWLRDRCFDLSVSPLAGGGISLLFADVTERQERERELARLAAEAEQASRAKSRFFAAVSHELRTPLHAIVGYTHLLSTESYGPVPEAATRAAERASVCAEHLARLIDDVLVMTTADLEQVPVEVQPLDLSRYLAEVLEPLRRQAEAKRLRFELEVPPGLPNPVADPARLRQVLYALVTNAIKFTSAGWVRVGVREVRGGVELRVEDSGRGIAEADRARVFEPFEQLGNDEARTDSPTRGTGLGLAVARRLAERMGVTLEVEASEVGGAAFVVQLGTGADPGEGAP